MAKQFRTIGLVELVHYILRLFKDDTKLPVVPSELPEDNLANQETTKRLNNGLKKLPKKTVGVPRRRSSRNR